LVKMMMGIHQAREDHVVVRPNPRGPLGLLGLYHSDGGDAVPLDQDIDVLGAGPVGQQNAVTVFK